MEEKVDIESSQTQIQDNLPEQEGDSSPLEQER
jgi:hypothetical protein